MSEKPTDESQIDQRWKYLNINKDNTCSFEIY